MTTVYPSSDVYFQQDNVTESIQNMILIFLWVPSMLYFFTKVQIHVVAEIAHKMWIHFMLQNVVTRKMIPGLRSMQTVFLYIFCVCIRVSSGTVSVRVHFRVSAVLCNS